MTSQVKRLLCQFSLGLFVSAFAAACSAQQFSESVPALSATEGKTKIALIVAPKGSALSQAASPIRQGILAASKENGGADRYEFIEYDLAAPQQIESVLKKAAEDGAMLALGPVARDAVEAVAQMPFLPLPVVAVNRPNTESTPELLLSIDISAESEVDQLARIAIENTADKKDLVSNSFVILSTADPYDERIARAMEKAIVQAGASAERRHVSVDQIAYLRQEMRGKAFRGVFFAMNAQNASLLRPYLPPELPVFGTSYTNPMHLSDQMRATTQSNDLVGMVTLEMPAERAPSNLVAEFTKGQNRPTPEEVQMFAVGVDAWRLGTSWLNWTSPIDIPHGESGKLHFDRSQSSRVQRELEKTVVSPARVKSGSKDDDLVQFTETAEEAGL